MKRSLVLLILLIALMGGNEVDTISHEFEKGFSILYSKEQWSLEEEPDVLMLFSKTISSADFRTNVNILMQDLSNQPMSLQDYHTLTL